MTIAVCWKWVSFDDDARYAGVSESDRAALELALRLGEVRTEDVAVVTLGPPEADGALREALALGAARALRVDAPTALRSDHVAAELAQVVTERLDAAAWICCGDASPDRGSGSVPATIAAILGRAQALGLVALDVAAAGPLRAIRRLDGGRREELLVDAPAVVSVEGSVARLRRASLGGELAARQSAVDVVAGPRGPCDAPAEIRPFRPRARALPSPAGTTALDRVRALIDAGATDAHGEVVELAPPEAAARIVAVLQEWGYLALPIDSTSVG